MQQIGANNLALSKSEQSDLLLEYKDEENPSSICQRPTSAMASLIEDISSTDTSIDTISLFNLLTNTQQHQHQHKKGLVDQDNDDDDDDEEELTAVANNNSDDKMVKILIKLLVKSCRIFDVATQKTDTRISYWRYANPIVALVKQRQAASRVKASATDAAIQTYDDGKEEEEGDGVAALAAGTGNNGDEESTMNDTVESENNLKTIIEANKTTTKTTVNQEETGRVAEGEGQSDANVKSHSRTSLLAKSIIELVNESLCDEKVTKKSYYEKEKSGMTKKGKSKNICEAN